MITYQDEPWDAVRDEIPELAASHFNECASGERPFSMDSPAYDAMNQAGMVHVTTARHEGRLVGYIVNIVMPRHISFEAKYAAHLGWFVAKEYRRKLVGLYLLKESEKFLKEKDVEVMFGSHMIETDASPLFNRLGWKKTEVHYTKWLKDN